MSTRKLTQEVERTLKKVNEGVELFDEILEKVYNAPNASQRDKFEGELKKEIKKLQRLREQIRAWIGGSEVKDKAELIEKRKIIEARMEKFKICEQKTKMKAYSKEALSQKQIQRRKKSKVIPETEEKKDAKDWIRDSQESIQTQMDDIERELEEEQKARKPDSDAIESFKRRLKSHQKYLDKLETAFMYLEDDQVKWEDIEEIKESVEYYIDENAEPDFVEDELVFDNLFKKAEEAEKYDDFEDIEDEVIMEGNIIQPLPANAEPVAVQLKTDESEVMKVMDDNAAKLKEKQEKEKLEREKLERIEKERLEELERQRLEQERLEQEKKLAAALASKNAKKTTTTTTAKVAPSPKTAAKQPTKQTKTTKTKTQPTPTPLKKVPTPELNFSSVVAAAAAQSPTKGSGPARAQPTSVLPKQAAPRLPSQNIKPTISYIDVINSGATTPTTQTAPSNGGSKGNTPRGAPTTPVSSTVTNASPVMHEPIQFNKNDMADITIQTMPTAPTPATTKSVVSNKDKKVGPGNIPIAATAGHIGQNIQQGVPFSHESDKSNDETFGSISSNAIGSIEDISSRTQELNQGFQMGMPSQNLAQHPGMSSASLLANTSVPHLDAAAMSSMQNLAASAMGGMMGMTSPVAANMGMSFPQSPSPTMPGVATTIPKPDVYDAKTELLQASLNNLPHTSDCERPREYTPMNPFDTPSFFPQEQLPVLRDPAIFMNMDPDTLFFIFYFQQGTYQQYLAAKALKKHAWRYHKKYQTWFQRHDQPKHTTNEYELGTYVYFDYEQDWCQRIKSGFRFEYEFLEDAVL